ncbi:MAG: hypothetical protein U9Q22_00715 [Candidatus Altiarchaeota archaeon]|nr:hypothetical protein [Candidatus Altiarchaeota archaeon]
MDKLFGKKVEVVDESIRFRLNELDDWLRDRMDEKEEKIHKEAAPILGEITKHIRNIKKQALKIDTLKCPDEIPQRARKVIITSTPAFVRGILDAIKGVEEKPAKEDMNTFNDKLQNTLSTLLKVSMGQGRYLPLAFGDELMEIRKESKQLFEKKKELEELLRGDALNDVKKDLETLKEKSLLPPALDKELMQFNDELKKVKTEKERLHNEYNGLDQTKDFKDLSEKKHQLKVIKEKKEGIENEVHNLLTPLRRPLKMFRRFIVEKEMPEVEGIKDYIQNPVEMFFSGEEEDINRLLEKMRSVMEEGELGIKEQERSKILFKINSLLNTDLEKLKKDFLFLKRREGEISNEIESASVLREKRDLENHIRRVDRDIALKKGGIDRVSGKRDKLVDEIEGLKKALEERLSNLENKKVSLELK